MKRQKTILIVLAGMAVFSYFSSGAIASYFSSNAISAERNSEESSEPSVDSLVLSNFGSLVLSDLNENLLSLSVELRYEVNQALEESEKDDVGCVAPTIRRPFTDLNHIRIAPFFCFFTEDKSLMIKAENLAILPNGEITRLEELLRRNNIPQGVLIQFSLTSWQWMDANHQSAVNESTEADR
ncbi:hypothetical protein H6F88_00120 [Oculatella sp. FACHB-28]|uniref:hypothetical protein n=1 Tax=Oculatella sp. FACHB-28 TaxID=2692845 RepID=UPI001689EB20|nr:hypothetical protein [Oculatella sp. FACHB-28]MBD2054457.1 hypothetical protein [Oculatella sp. FACHB-28]